MAGSLEHLLSIPLSQLMPQTALQKLSVLVQQAGDGILTIYRDESLWLASEKADDTPVTAADVCASDILVAGLPAIVNCPVVSEEALPNYEQRAGWPLYWLIDPMDGTREFLHKTDEFVINVALMKHHQPIFGLIYQPTTKDLWWGGEQLGAFSGCVETPVRLPKAEMSMSLTALGSRRSRWKGQWRDILTQQGYEVSTNAVGSALKFARLAQGLGDLYPRLGPTSEWDTAAPQAILAETGGAIVQWDGSPIEYGKPNTLNPHFIAVRDKRLLTVLGIPS